MSHIFRHLQILAGDRPTFEVNVMHMADPKDSKKSICGMEVPFTLITSTESEADCWRCKKYSEDIDWNNRDLACKTPSVW